MGFYVWVQARCDVVVLNLWSGWIGMLKKLCLKSNFEKMVHPWILCVKFFNNGNGYASKVSVLRFNSRKSEQHLTPPPGLLARVKLEVQSVLLLADTGLMIPFLCDRRF